MTKEIYVEHPAVNDGTETQLVDVEMTPDLRTATHARRGSADGGY